VTGRGSDTSEGAVELARSRKTSKRKEERTRSRIERVGLVGERKIEAAVAGSDEEEGEEQGSAAGRSSLPSPGVAARVEGEDGSADDGSAVEGRTVPGEEEGRSRWCRKQARIGSVEGSRRKRPEGVGRGRKWELRLERDPVDSIEGCSNLARSRAPSLLQPTTASTWPRISTRGRGLRGSKRRFRASEPR